MAANPALIKAIVMVATDKRTWKFIGAILAGFFCLCLLPAFMLLALFSNNPEVDMDKLLAQIEMTAVVDELSTEKKEELEYLDTVMQAIYDEIKNQEVDINPIKAQIIYLCVLQGKEKNNSNFYSDFISILNDASTDAAIFNNISSKYGVAFTKEEKEKILLLIEKMLNIQMVIPKKIHALIVEKINAAPMSYIESYYTSPFKTINYKVNITSHYGKRDDPITSEKGVEHSGLDISAATGTDIFPVKNGRVLIVGNDPDGYGRYVIIYHGGKTATLYAHCSQILVSEEQDINTDTAIAQVGSTGRSTGPHLHIEFVIDGKPVNPLNYLK